MTDFTYDNGMSDQPATGYTKPADGFFARPASGMFRDLYEDFRAVPVEAWIILAVATGLSNLFIALA